MKFKGDKTVKLTPAVVCTPLYGSKCASVPLPLCKFKRVENGFSTWVLFGLQERPPIVEYSPPLYLPFPPTILIPCWLVSFRRSPSPAEFPFLFLKKGPRHETCSPYIQNRYFLLLLPRFLVHHRKNCIRIAESSFHLHICRSR